MKNYRSPDRDRETNCIVRYAICTAHKQPPSDNETAWNAFVRLALALLVYDIHHKDRLPNIFFITVLPIQ